MNCDAIAGVYRWFEYAAFGKALERCRFSQLGELSGPKRALILGDGDGRFLLAFAMQHPQTAIEYMDVSGAMLTLARRRIETSPVPDRSRICFSQSDVRTVDLRGRGYDLIACHFFFDVFTQIELEAIVQRVGQSAAAGAEWVISEFDLPAGKAARWRALILLRIMYRFFRITTGLANQKLPEWRPLLRRQGFSNKSAFKQRNGFIVSELWTRSGERSDSLIACRGSSVDPSPQQA